MKATALIPFLIVSATALADIVNFADAKTGVLPAYWLGTQTGSGAAKWTVEKADDSPSKPNVLCFLWIFLGAPHIEQLRGNVKLTTALSAVTAAVVGIVLNLAVWFGIHVLFPDGKMLDWFALVLSAVAFIGMLRWKWDVIPVVIGSGLIGLVYEVGAHL